MFSHDHANKVTGCMKDKTTNSCITF